MKIVVSPKFLKFKKKSINKIQEEMDKQVNFIISHPDCGEMKEGDLSGIRVHKFNFQKKQYLLSYEVIAETLNLYSIGHHENFYRDLKDYLS